MRVDRSTWKRCTFHLLLVPLPLLVLLMRQENSRKILASQSFYFKLIRVKQINWKLDAEGVEIIDQKESIEHKEIN